MIDPDLMRENDPEEDDGPTLLFSALLAAIVIFALGALAGWLVAWL